MKRGSVNVAVACCAAAAFVVLNWLERRRPLRKQVEPKLRREARNLAVAGLGAIVVQLVERPVVLAIAESVEQRHWGLLPRLGLPQWAEIATALILMDYTFYIWHMLMHRVPLLWRFHLVHHIDLDMDASTALRFHFGELLVSVPWRALQVALLGLTPLSFSIWQGVFMISILFHHSDVELPVAWERRLNFWIVTPRMHGIHHSIVPRETDANFSNGLTCWDALHRTLYLNVPADTVQIGVAAFRDPHELTLPKILTLPFRLPDVPVEPRQPGGRHA